MVSLKLTSDFASSGVCWLESSLWALTWKEIKNEIKVGENFLNILQNKKQKLLEIGFEKIDYLEIRDEENLQLLQNFDDEKNSRIFIAIYLNDVRLIDNLKL